MRRIVIVSELFYPDWTSTAHILTKIADHLSRNHEVLVLAGPKSYSSDNVNDTSDASKPYDIQRVKIGEYDKNKIFHRILRFCIMSAKLGQLLWQRGREEDDVLIVTNPAPFIMVAAVLKRLRGFNLNILVHDVFPENAVAAGMIKSDKGLVYRVLKRIFRSAYRSADNVIVLGRDMHEIFQQKFKGLKHPPAIRIIENWADPCPAPVASPRCPDGHVRILYAGNIGRCQGLESFIEVFGKTSNRAVQLMMRGGGAMVETIKDNMEHTDADIKLGGSYSRDEQFKILEECDVALVTLASGMYGLGVPSKSYNIMAAGKPILFVGDLRSEIAQVVREHGIGYCFSSEDGEGLLKWLDSITPEMREEFRRMGEKARRLATTIYSEQSVLSKYSDLFGH